MAHIYEVGTRAWQPDTTEGWVASEVTDKSVEGDKVKLVFTLANGEVFAPSAAAHTAGSIANRHNRRRRSRRPWPPSRTATTLTCRP